MLIMSKFLFKVAYVCVQNTSVKITRTNYFQLYDKIKKEKEVEHHMNANMEVSTVDLSESGTRAVVEFTASSVAVLENEGKVRVGIRRYGKLDIPVTVTYVHSFYVHYLIYEYMGMWVRIGPQHPLLVVKGD
jgi:hypothetical protein